jgi:hypothetical protein
MVRVDVKPPEDPDEGLKLPEAPEGRVVVMVRLTVATHPELTVIVFDP